MATITPLIPPAVGKVSDDKASAMAALESLLAIRFFEEAPFGERKGHKKVVIDSFCNVILIFWVTEVNLRKLN